MKKHFSMLAAALIAAGTFSAPVFAAEHYISTNVGVSWINEIPTSSWQNLRTDAGTNMTAALGCDYGAYRLEVEAGYQNNDFSNNGNIKILSLLGNGYINLKNEGARPYLTAGLGGAQVRLKDVTLGGQVRESDDDTVIAYQVGAGVEVPIAKKAFFDVRYRYFGTADINTIFTGDRGIDSHNVLVGLRWNF
ncbi:MAG TPA: outer membrane beta-barrel protein, partial [Chlorobaculum sp.]|nr:outer membrane beta-barrel protein [Chlorobaculum sp.]